MLVLRVSIWLALLGWLAGPLAAWIRPKHPGWQRTARRLWTLGCLAFLVHVATAFEVVHDWSHEDAWHATARDTAAVMGSDPSETSGAGLWLNYLFGLAWIVDAAWWWRAGLERYRARGATATWTVYGFMLFMAFNATVVFEEGPVRWAGALATVGLVVAWIRAVRRRRTATRSS